MSESRPILAYSTHPTPSRDWSGEAIFDWVVISLIGIVLVGYLATKAGFDLDGLVVFAGVIFVPSSWMIMIIRLSVYRLRGNLLPLSGIMILVSILLTLAVIANFPRC